MAESKLEAFLFAPIGEEGNGMTLSVLSGLSRLDIDPWEEAAQLSRLPKAHAIKALSGRIARLPQGTWQASDVAVIAARLVELLPRHDAGEARGSAEPRPRTRRWTKLVLWLVAAGLVLSLLFGLPAQVQRLLAGPGIDMPVATPSARR